jgi:hypothetical protein
MRRQWLKSGVGEEILGESSRIERARNSAVGHVLIILKVKTN